MTLQQVPLPPERQLMTLLRGKYVSRAITAAADLGVADVLAEGELDARELAARTGAHEDALYRLLRALVALGLFEERGERTFANNRLSSCLRSDHPASLRAAASWMNGDAAWRAWGRLDHSLATGASAFEAVFGKMVFDYFEEHPQQGVHFQQAMALVSRMTAGAVVQAFDFSRFGRLVDVGGGHGALLLAILERHPSARGVLFDRADVLARAELPRELAGRVELQAGSFFEELPRGADAYLLKSVLHDWDDDACVRILAVCRAALAPSSRLLVIDNLVGSGPESLATKLLDLEMLVMTRGGRERDQAEFSRLFARAGLRLERVHSTPSSLSVLECAAE